jgi:AcrR family transcriptional regulator
VTIDEIAEAADVSRMTVFNHFSRKEDMFFDLDDEGRDDMLNALQKRDHATAPLEALRLFVHWAVAQQRPYVLFFEAGSGRFMATLQASEVLRARARAIRDELTDVLTVALARSKKRVMPDPAASLAASLLVATCTVALNEAYRVFYRDKNVDAANKAFLRIVDWGTRGVKAAMKGTPYQ